MLTVVKKSKVVFQYSYIPLEKGNHIAEFSQRKINGSLSKNFGGFKFLESFTTVIV
jgi:hypothetical protein